MCGAELRTGGGIRTVDTLPRPRLRSDIVTEREDFKKGILNSKMCGAELRTGGGIRTVDTLPTVAGSACSKDITDPTTFTSKDCLANCLVMGNTGLPANPVMARIVCGKCACVAPQICESRS